MALPFFYSPRIGSPIPPPKQKCPGISHGHNIAHTNKCDPRAFYFTIICHCVVVGAKFY